MPSGKEFSPEENACQAIGRCLDKDGVSHFQSLQNALRHEAKLLYCVFDLIFHNGGDLSGLTLLERKAKSILPRR
jgi:bifunctional non-homologous end joining protein LigD